MNSPTRQSAIRELALRIATKQAEIEAARERDAEFAEMKKLYLDLKKVTNDLQAVLNEVNLAVISSCRNK
jgi:hypothetical protein